MRNCVTLALILGVLLLVFHSIAPSIGRHDYVSEDEDLLNGLPIPAFDPDLGLAARFSLLFPGSDNKPLSVGSSAGSAVSAGDIRLTRSRLVIIPDLHGDGQQALRALQLAGLVTVVPAVQTASGDAAGAAAASGAGPEQAWRLPLPGGPAGQRLGGDWQWTGGDTVLVQLGDVLDRGADSLALLVLLDRLRHQARAAGGDVVMLLGNHELMNIQHDFRYVALSEALALAKAGDLPPGWSRTTVSLANGRELAAGDGGAAAPGRAGSHDGSKTSRGVDFVQRELESVGKEGAEEDASLQTETTMGTNPRGRSPGERELLSGREDADGGAIRAADAGAAAAKPTRGSVFQRNLLQQQHRNHQQLLRGLELWRNALSADAPLGSLIRHRRLAAIVDAGGCRILAVHAGAFPWMLRAIEAMLLPPGTAGVGDEWQKRPETEVGNSTTGTTAPYGLQPEHYIGAWNAAVIEMLRGCEGRRCRQGGDAAAAATASSTGDAYGRFRQALADLLLGGEGAIWSRRYMHASPQQVCAEVSLVAQRLAVQRLVVGHTVQRGGRVSRRCGGQLLMADVGLSQAIAGEMAVLQCTAGKLDVMYGNGRVDRL